MSKPLDFPIPYPGQTPDEDLASARRLLEAVTFHMEDGSHLTSSEVQTLFTVLCAADEKLSVIQVFLDNCDFPGMATDYQSARRSWIMQKGGAR